jgi:hypothetical protein
MKKLFLIAVIFCAISCAKKQEEVKEAESVVVSDTLKAPAVGAGEDLHGCKSSAGYTWSELEKECIRIFEKGTRLTPVKSETGEILMPAFVIFKGDKAEVFMQTEKAPIVMERKSEGEPFINGDWHLISWKGYVLKKGKRIMFTGQ